MENFEYSIRLNDRDWAEFYLASEECSLIQPALATADEPLLSDLEEGELEQIRWGAVPAHDTASSHIAPDAQLLAEDLLSGSEDETELGSVSRFLCHNNPSNIVPPSWTQEIQLSSVTSKHLGSQFGMTTPTSTRENEAVFFAKEGDSEMRNLPNNSDSSTQERHLQDQHVGKERMERPLSMNHAASAEMDVTARENGNETISLQFQPAQNEALQTSSAGSQTSTSRDGAVAAENSDSLRQRDPITYPCSPGVSSPHTTKPEGAKNPEKSSNDLQRILQGSSNEALQASSGSSQSSTYGTVAAENVESSRQRDPITYPCSLGVSSPHTTKPEGTKNPEKSSKDLKGSSNEALQTSSGSSQSSIYGTVAAENSESLWQRDPITYPCSPSVSSPRTTKPEGISTYGTVTAENVDSPRQRDPITYPCSPGVSSPRTTKPEGTKNPEKSSKDPQRILQGSSNEALQTSSGSSQSSVYGTVAAENSQSLRQRDPITYPFSPGVSSPRPTKPEGISTYGTIAAENVESLQQRDPITYPCSPGVSSPCTNKPEGTKNPEKSSKDLQGSSNEALQTSSGSSQSSIYGTVVAENVESLRQRDPITYPCSPVVSSPCTTKPEGTKNPEKSSKALQRILQGSSNEALQTSSGNSQSSIYGTVASGLVRCDDRWDVPKERDQVGQVSSSPCEDVALFVPYFLTSQDSPETHKRRGNMWEGTGKEGPASHPATELPSMSGPEMYEYFFDEIDETQRSKDRGDKDTVPTTPLLSGHRSTPSGVTEHPNSEEAVDAVQISIPEVYEYFFDSSARGKRNWRGVLLSFPASEARKAARALKSLISRHMRRVKPQPTNHGELLRRGSKGTLVLLSPGLLTETRSRAEDLHMAVMEPERPLRPVLTHRDVCLGFVAFASWAVKTTDLQAPDAWKIVLLANFGTLSAIRYFRRQVITEGQHTT